MEWIKQQYHLISLDDFFQGDLSRKKTNIAITFDDGFKNWIRNAVPVLKELDIPATFFINSSSVGLSDRESLEFCKNTLKLTPEVGLSWEDVKAINKDGFKVGGHTRNHINLGKDFDPYYLKEEIIGDKKRIEGHIGQKMRYFAYPFGSIADLSFDALQVIQEAGYKAAFTIIPGFNLKTTDRYMIHRDSLDVSLSDILFKAWISGSYDLFKQIINKVKC